MLEDRSKIIGDNMLKSGINKEGRMEGDLKIDDQKGDDPRVPVEMWDMRAWSYEGYMESKAPNVLRESVLIWWRQKLGREFAQLLRRSLGSRKGMVPVKVKERRHESICGFR